MIRQRTAMLLAAIAGLLLLTGCKEEEYTLRFSHHLHVTELEMDCDECHGEAGETPFRVISHDTCTDCHDEPEAEEISEETCGLCHEKKQLGLLKDWEKTAVTPKQRAFVHTEALAERCMECHGTLMDEAFKSVPLLQRDDVVRMRDEAHRSGQDCLTCHVDMDRYEAPASHDLHWTKRHGLFGIQDDAACSVCHSEQSCRECHSVMMPTSHNNLWRLRTHGMEAAWDRQRCMVCHEVDSCQSCHSQVPPRSHRARWSETHCYGCHTDATPGEGCIVCHEEGNNVLLHQDFWPPVHDRFGNQANCYDCHNPFEN